MRSCVCSSRPALCAVHAARHLHDNTPRGATLLGFGGAAGLHACAVADSLQMVSVLLPCNPGLLSAGGVLEGSFSRDLRAALSLQDPDIGELRHLRHRVAGHLGLTAQQHQVVAVHLDLDR